MRFVIPFDKKLHLAAGYIITLTLGIVFAVGVGILAGVLAGIGKEVWDEYKFRLGEHPTGFDRRDMFFTWVGTAVAGFLLVTAV